MGGWVTGRNCRIILFLDHNCTWKILGGHLNTLFSPSGSAPLSPLLLVFTPTPPKKETLSTKMADITRGCCHDLSTYCSYLCTYPNCRKLCTTPQLKETLHTITIKKTAIPYVQKSVKNAPEISHCGAQVVIKKVKKIPTHPGAVSLPWCFCVYRVHTALLERKTPITTLQFPFPSSIIARVWKLQNVKLSQ